MRAFRGITIIAKNVLAKWLPRNKLAEETHERQLVTLKMGRTCTQGRETLSSSQWSTLRNATGSKSATAWIDQPASIHHSRYTGCSRPANSMMNRTMIDSSNCPLISSRINLRASYATIASR